MHAHHLNSEAEMDGEWAFEIVSPITSFLPLRRENCQDNTTVMSQNMALGFLSNGMSLALTFP